MKGGNEVETLVMDGEVSTKVIVALGKEGWMFVRYDVAENVSVFQRSVPGKFDSIVESVGEEAGNVWSVFKTVGLTGGCLVVGGLSALLSAASEGMNGAMERHLNGLVRECEVTNRDEEQELSEAASDLAEKVRGRSIFDEIGESFHRGAEEVARRSDEITDAGREERL